MSRCTLRNLLTVLSYAGVAIVLVPYLRGHTTTGLMFLLGGIGLSLVCGFLRCYLTEGDCSDRLPPPLSDDRVGFRGSHRGPR